MRLRQVSGINTHGVPEIAFVLGHELRIRLCLQAIEVFQQNPAILPCVARPGIVAEPVRIARPGEVRQGDDDLI